MSKTIWRSLEKTIFLGRQRKCGKTVDIPKQAGYISKAVKGNSKTQTTKVARRANPNALNLDNYIV